MGDPHEKCAVVLGASGALGSAVAKHFAEKGFRVMGTGFRRAPSFQPSLQLDMTQTAEVNCLEDWLREQTPRIDVAVHCVGVARDSVVTKMSDQAWRESLDVNLKSAYRITRLLLPWFTRQRGGHFLFVSSWAARAGRAGQANYAAAKAGLIGLTQSIAREYASRGVQANCIIPGVFRSAMTDTLPPAALERLWSAATIQKFSDLDEIARFIVDLASMRGVSGQVFQLDGRIGSANL